MSFLPCMASQKYHRHIFLLFLLILLLFYLFPFNSYSTNVAYPQNIFESVRRSPADLIDGKDRFEWYKEMWKEHRKAEKLKKIDDISLYYAYEYEHEYSISYTTPEIVSSRVFCRYLDSQDKELLPPNESFTFPEFVINCPKRNGTQRIAITTNATTTDFSFSLPLINRQFKEPKYELSVCLSPIYGNESKWLMFSELVEHYKLQGVSHFYVYIHHVDEYSSKIIEDYARSGEVEIHYLLERHGREDSRWQMVMYRDCTLRSRHESRWSIFADIDERLIMTEYPGTILDYLRDKDSSSLAGIQFRQRWIMKTEFMPAKYENETQIEKWMPILRWHNTSHVGPPGHTTKCVIDPTRVFAMWVHYPTIKFPKFDMIRLTPEEGVVRHYRDLQLGNWGNRWLKEVLGFGNLTMTDYSEEYQERVVENVKKRVKYVYENFEKD